MNKLIVAIFLASSVSMAANASLVDRINEARSFPTQPQDTENRKKALNIEHEKLHKMHDDLHVRLEALHAKMSESDQEAMSHSHERNILLQIINIKH